MYVLDTPCLIFISQRPGASRIIEILNSKFDGTQLLTTCRTRFNCGSKLLDNVVTEHLLVAAAATAAAQFPCWWRFQLFPAPITIPVQIEMVPNGWRSSFRVWGISIGSLNVRCRCEMHWQKGYRIMYRFDIYQLMYCSGSLLFCTFRPFAFPKLQYLVSGILDILYNRHIGVTLDEQECMHLQYLHVKQVSPWIHVQCPSLYCTWKRYFTSQTRFISLFVLIRCG